MSKKNKFIWTDNEWTFDRIEKVDRELSKINEKKYKLDLYPTQIEIINSDQMLGAYATVAMPIYYDHWSFGKQYAIQKQQYKRGEMGLAYEVVINTNPSIAYLMEENTMTMQSLVIAHACYGHNGFFYNNYLFKQWTDASTIMDYLMFAKKYISDCEEKYGEAAVEEILDSAHSLSNYGVDRYKKPRKLSIEKEKMRTYERELESLKMMDDIWQALPKDKKVKKKKQVRFPAEPQENLLYFIEKNSPVLEPWQREIVRIVRKIAQYFYPQRQTQVMNEGFASFMHYNLMYDLYESNLVHEGVILEFLKSHSSVIFQPDWDKKYFNGINVYALGYNMMTDIKRICENPNAEDLKWFPDICNTDYIETIKYIVKNYKDESFIMQFLSPNVIRKMKLFSLHDDVNNYYNYEINNIHDDRGYKNLRQILSKQYNLSFRDPDIQIYDVDTTGDRSLVLRHYMYDGIQLHDSTINVLKHVRRLWGYDVFLDSVNTNNEIIKTFKCAKDG